MTKTGNEFIAFVFKAPVLLKIFQTMYECGKELGSSRCHCHGEALFVFLHVFQVKLVWVVSAFPNPTKLRPSDLVLFVTPGSQR